MNYRASRVTKVDLSVDRIIASGETITVFGMILSNAESTIAEIDIQDAAGNVFMTIVVPANETVISNIEFVADGGLQFDGIGSTMVYANVFHSGGGS